MRLFLARLILSAHAFGGCGTVYVDRVGGMNDTGTDTDTGQDPADLTACEGLSTPYFDAPCLDALMARCTAFDSERDCVVQETAVFSDGAYEIACAWAKVVSFIDPDTCAVAAVEGRCVAATLSPQGCSDSCGGDPSIDAVPRVSGMDIYIPAHCGADGRALDLHAGEGCYSNVTAPIPDLCTCAEAACDA